MLYYQSMCEFISEIMKKQSANTGSTFNKNMTNTETLTFDNSTVSSNICIPVLTAPLTPSNQIARIALH